MTNEQRTELLKDARQGSTAATLTLSAELQNIGARADRDEAPKDWTADRAFIDECKTVGFPFLTLLADAARNAEHSRLGRIARREAFGG